MTRNRANTKPHFDGRGYVTSKGYMATDKQLRYLYRLLDGDMDWEEAEKLTNKRCRILISELEDGEIVSREADEALASICQGYADDPWSW